MEISLFILLTGLIISLPLWFIGVAIAILIEIAFKGRK